MKIKKLGKTDIRDFSLVLIVVGVAVFAYLYLSNPDRLIGEALVRMGYGAEAVEIEQVDFWKGIYKANTAITDKDGNSVEFWQIKEIPHLTTLRYAAPYFPAEADNFTPAMYAASCNSACSRCCGLNA